MLDQMQQFLRSPVPPWAFGGGMLFGAQALWRGHRYASARRWKFVLDAAAFWTMGSGAYFLYIYCRQFGAARAALGLLYGFGISVLLTLLTFRYDERVIAVVALVLAIASGYALSSSITWH